MRTESVPNCIFCHVEGSAVYTGLSDRLFGASGSWNFRRCPNAGCRLMWLDPRPVEEDIKEAYSQYYTHDPDVGSAGSLRPAAVRMARRFLYLLNGVGSLTQEHAQLWAMYLSGVRPGRLLDVGCGGGARLTHFQNAGWKVEGQEVDPDAAKLARETANVPVYCMPLEAAGLEAHFYDAIILNHVLEHLHRPHDLLRECGRLVKPGGVIVLVTPNSASYGHQVFGTSWRALEPPRHIFLYSPTSIARLAEDCDFRTFDVWSSAANAEDIFLRSNSLLAAESGVRESPLRIRARAYGFLRAAYAQNRKTGRCGEDLVLRVRG